MQHVGIFKMSRTQKAGPKANNMANKLGVGGIVWGNCCFFRAYCFFNGSLRREEGFQYCFRHDWQIPIFAQIWNYNTHTLKIQEQIQHHFTHTHTHTYTYTPANAYTHTHTHTYTFTYTYTYTCTYTYTYPCTYTCTCTYPYTYTSLLSSTPQLATSLIYCSTFIAIHCCSGSLQCSHCALLCFSSARS